MDDDSPFYGRIVTTTSPKKGQLSLNNFVRKVAPLVIQDKGHLGVYPQKIQTAIISNYYQSLRVVFPREFNKHDSVFFQTLGFGALMNVLPVFFNLCFKHYKAFKVEDAVNIFNEIKHFDFKTWKSYGTGNAAEIQAGQDVREELSEAFEAHPEGGGFIEV